MNASDIHDQSNNGRNKRLAYLSLVCLLVSPVSTKGASISTSAPGRAGFEFSVGFWFWEEVPEEIDSCLASTRCRSSFRASPWHSSDSSLENSQKRIIIN